MKIALNINLVCRKGDQQPVGRNKKTKKTLSDRLIATQSTDKGESEI